MKELFRKKFKLKSDSIDAESEAATHLAVTKTTHQAESNGEEELRAQGIAVATRAELSAIIAFLGVATLMVWPGWFFLADLNMGQFVGGYLGFEDVQNQREPWTPLLFQLAWTQIATFWLTIPRGIFEVWASMDKYKNFFVWALFLIPVFILSWSFHIATNKALSNGRKGVWLVANLLGWIVFMPLPAFMYWLKYIWNQPHQGTTNVSSNALSSIVYATAFTVTLCMVWYNVIGYLDYIAGSWEWGPGITELQKLKGKILMATTDISPNTMIWSSPLQFLVRYNVEPFTREKLQWLMVLICWILLPGYSNHIANNEYLNRPGKSFWFTLSMVGIFFLLPVPVLYSIFCFLKAPRIRAIDSKKLEDKLSL